MYMMIFHEFCLPYLLFLKKEKKLKSPSASNYRWRFMGFNMGSQGTDQPMHLSKLRVQFHFYLMVRMCKN